MYAHALRKWSLAKNLMYILLPVLVLLVFWCPLTTAMHLSPSSFSQTLPSSSSSSLLTASHHANDDTIINNLNNKNFIPKHKYNNRPYTDININNNNNINHNQKDPSDPNYTNSQKFAHNFVIDNNNNNNNESNNFNLTNTNSVAESDRVELNESNVMRRSRRQILVGHIERNRIDMNSQSHKTAQNTNIVPKTIQNETLFNNLANNLLHQHKKQEEASLNRFSMQLRIKRARNDSHRRRRRHRLVLSSERNSIIAGEPKNTYGGAQPFSTIQQQQIGRSRRESRPDSNSGNAMSRLNPFPNSRTRQRRFCSARDPTTLAFEAPTVFEGKVRSMSSDRRRNFSVTFEVKEIYKRQLGLKLPLLIRLKFTYRNTSECDIYRETFRLVGHVRDELEQGKVYILFVNQIDLGNFTMLGQPIKRTRKAVADVRTGVNEKYGQRAYIESLVANNATIREGKRLRIVCKVRGQPPPKVTWFKDDRSIAKNRSKYQFIHLRRRSELIIKSAFVNDSGQYECRAKNKLARQPVRKFSRIEVLPKIQEFTRHPFPPINWTHSGSPCPVIGNAFCLNGGTCVFFKDVGEPACKCPDGFLGNRCETKNPTNILHSNPTHSSFFLDNGMQSTKTDRRHTFHQGKKYLFQ